MSIARPRLGEGEGLASTLPGDHTSTVERPSPSRGAGDGLLAIDRLGRRFGDREVIESLTLTMDRGDRVALRGANGSGKTTILRCITGTVAPTRGRISIGGYAAGSVGGRQLIGAALAQERSFYLRLTGHANLMCFARLRGESGRSVGEQVRALEEELEIDGFVGEKAQTYSAGMLQQLAFARALLGNPALLLLDEPTRSLDPGAIERLWRALERRPHAAVMLATHNRDDLEHCDERVELPT
jgi:ABC-type multidrug transport system ATPase subunit